MTGFKKLLTKKDAIDLLTNANSDLTGFSETRYINEYGDYIFPTDYVMSTPNTAVGSSEGIEILELLPSEKE